MHSRLTSSEAQRYHEAGANVLWNAVCLAGHAGNLGSAGILNMATASKTCTTPAAQTAVEALQHTPNHKTPREIALSHTCTPHNITNNASLITLS
jgi:hypothetical protein